MNQRLSAIEQDPPPEISFPWRRTVTILASAALFGLQWRVVALLPPEALLPFSQGLMALQALIWLFYFGGASAADIGQLLAHAWLRLRPGSGPRESGR